MWLVALLLIPRVPLPNSDRLAVSESRVDADVRQQAAAAITQQPSHKSPRCIPTHFGGGAPSGPEG
jgi:hypothetical protein